MIRIKKRSHTIFQLSPTISVRVDPPGGRPFYVATPEVLGAPLLDFIATGETEDGAYRACSQRAHRILDLARALVAALDEVEATKLRPR